MDDVELPVAVEETAAPATAERANRLEGYRGALAVAPFRRLFIGELLSTLCDGCGFVAVAWLALQLATAPERPYAVGLALGAYTLPGAIVGLAGAGRMARFGARPVMIADAILRMTLLGCIPVVYALGALTLWVYLVLLAGAGLLVSFGRGGFVSVVAAHVPEQYRFSANSLTSTTEMVTLALIGPAIGGVLVAAIGAPSVIVINAAGFVALLWAAVRLPPSTATHDPAEKQVRLRDLLHRPLIGWLLALTIIFYGLYGPIETALPIFVRSDLHAGSKLYGILWAAFGAGAFMGGLLAGTRTIKHIERFALVVVAGWGLSVLLIGGTVIPVVVSLGMLAGGFIYAPYPAVTTTALQQALPPAELAVGAAAWTSMVAVLPATTITIGGPLVAALGPRVTILGSGISTIGLAILVTAVRFRPRRRPVG